jgi:hypothetical protein
VLAGSEASVPPGRARRRWLRPFWAAHRQVLFDARIWHDGMDWKAFSIKASRAKIIGSLRRLAEVEFDIPQAETRVADPTRSVLDHHGFG